MELDVVSRLYNDCYWNKLFFLKAGTFDLEIWVIGEDLIKLFLEELSDRLESYPSLGFY